MGSERPGAVAIRLRTFITSTVLEPFWKLVEYLLAKRSFLSLRETGQGMQGYSENVSGTKPAS